MGNVNKNDISKYLNQVNSIILNNNKTTKPTGRYHLDINTTSACNLRCKYCYESCSFDKTIKEFQTSNLDKLKTIIYDFMNTEWFASNFNGIAIGFWGGESSLNPDIICEMAEIFANDDRIRLFIYSNGYKIEKLYPILNKFKQQTSMGEPKLSIQISYDGYDAHNINRLDVNRNGTADKVRKTIIYLIDNEIPHVIKSTIDVYTFSKLYDSYCDLLDIYDYAKTKNLKVMYNTSYFPTIDYMSGSENNIDINNYIEILEEQMIKIVSHEIKRIKQDKSNFPFFSWLTANKALCSAGFSMSAVDTDGNIYVCHGCLYDDEIKENTIIGNIKDSDIINNLINKSKYHKTFQNKQPEECIKCSAVVCYRCNPAKFKLSEMNKFEDRWTDYAVQPHLCKFYKKISNIRRAFYKLIQESGEGNATKSKCTMSI